MADVTRRLAQWQKKFTPERAKGALEAIYEDISRRYAAAVTELCQMEEKTREVLNLSGIHTTMFVPYLDFARELFRLSRKRHIAGESLILAAQVLLQKWANRGLDPLVLAAIRTQVFDIGPPAP
ncbi:MAG: hypothetical protein ABIK44_05460 [candidate division WOR-3 bacterium]